MPKNFQPLDTFQLLESSTVGFWVSKIPNIFQPFEKIIQRLEISNVWNVENIGYETFMPTLIYAAREKRKQTFCQSEILDLVSGKAFSIWLSSQQVLLSTEISR